MLGALLVGCNTAETSACGDLYLHVHYAGIGGGYRAVVLNEERSFRLSGSEAVSKYVAGPEAKVAFENENSIFIRCGEEVEFVTDSEPASATLDARFSVRLIAPYEMRDLDETTFSFVIR